MASRVDLPAGLPGFRRGECLGCGKLVVAARDAWVSIGGTRDGSWLMASEIEPYRAWQDAGSATGPCFLLGVAHRTCVHQARVRLSRGEIALGDLPVLEVDYPDEFATPLDDLSRPPAAHACAFCPNRSTSEEHVIGVWVSKLFGEQGAVLAGPLNRDGRIRIVTDRVCATCNDTWLSVLENDASAVLRPLILGHNRSLNADEQSVVAAWAFKTALMLDLSSGPFIPLGFFRDFKLRRRPHESSLVWLGAYSGARAVLVYEQPLGFGAAPGEPPMATVITFSVGRALFQVLLHFTAGSASLSGPRLLGGGPPSNMAV